MSAFVLMRYPDAITSSFYILLWQKPFVFLGTKAKDIILSVADVRFAVRTVL